MGETEIQFEKLGNLYRLNTWLQFSCAEREKLFIIFHGTAAWRTVQQ